MFNKYYIGGNTTNTKCEVNLNAPSTGFIQKSNPVSRFIRFKRGSEIEKLLFPIDPREKPRLEYTESYKNPYYEGRSYQEPYYEKKHIEEIVILQVCIFGDDYMLAEYVFKKDMNSNECENNL